MAKLNEEWWNAFDCSFEDEEEVIEFIFERLNTDDFEDSYINVGGRGNPKEYFIKTVEDKRQVLYDFMIYLVKGGSK